MKDFRLTGGEKIQEFQRKLYEKAKANRKFRFYSLYDKVYRSDILEAAYRRVRANGGACGVDGVTFADIKAKGGTKGRTVQTKAGKAGVYPEVEWKGKTIGYTDHSRPDSADGILNGT